MATQGPLSPATTVDDATVGTISWVNPNKAQVLDGVYAVAGVNPGTAQSHYLNATNFGFSIPTGATINGVLLETYFTHSGSATDKSVKLVKGGTIGGTEHSASTNLGGHDSSYFPYGNSTDLWGLTLTPADINASNFGAVVSYQGIPSTGGLVNVDHIRITVTYTAASSASISNIQSITNIISLTL
jgi:hypothetical protein